MEFELATNKITAKDVLIQSDPKTNIKSSKDVLIIDHPLLVKEQQY